MIWSYMFRQYINLSLVDVCLSVNCSNQNIQILNLSSFSIIQQKKKILQNKSFFIQFHFFSSENEGF